MPATDEPGPALPGYVDSPRIVSTEWLSANIGNPKVKAVEVDEDPRLYAIGHVPGALRIDWLTDLADPSRRDVVDGARFTDLMRANGINRDDTVVLYGDRNNRWAAYLLWVFTLFGHDDVRLLDGGRGAWHDEGRETTLDLPCASFSDYPEVARDDTGIRVFRDEVESSDTCVLDVRSPTEFTGEAVHDRTSPAARGGHIPSARNIPWDRVFTSHGKFLPRTDLERVYAPVPADDDIVVYCHTGELACHTWFVLTFLLGRRGVRVYDGSWTEWANTVGAPIAKGNP